MLNRGFTLVDSLAVVVVAGAGLSLMMVAIGQPGTAAAPGKQPESTAASKMEGKADALPAGKSSKLSEAEMRDTDHVRAIHRGMIDFAQNNGGSYPLPSVMDKAGGTVKEKGDEKNTTSNIISILIYNGFFGPDVCISPAEVNGNIKAYGAYQYSKPPKAVTPAMALWDPGFSSDFSQGRTGGFSYAHTLPSRSRLDVNWKYNFNAMTPVVCNRGPNVTGVEIKGDGAEPRFEGKSNTLRIHGPADTWDGMVAFNDNHVNFLHTPWQRGQTYTTKTGERRPDVFFYNEPDDGADTNDMVGNFIKAGGATGDFKPIWD